MKIYTAICGCGIVLYVALLFLTGVASDFAQGISMGVFVGLEIVAVYYLVKTLTALRNEEKLKEMYIAETDERNIEIQKETSQKSLTISTAGITIAAIVAGLFDVKICITLACALFFSAIVTIIMNAYYNKKM